MYPLTRRKKNLNASESPNQTKNYPIFLLKKVPDIFWFRSKTKLKKPELD